MAIVCHCAVCHSIYLSAVMMIFFRSSRRCAARKVISERRILVLVVEKTDIHYAFSRAICRNSSRGNKKCPTPGVGCCSVVVVVGLQSPTYIPNTQSALSEIYIYLETVYIYGIEFIFMPADGNCKINPQ